MSAQNTAFMEDLQTRLAALGITTDWMGDLLYWESADKKRHVVWDEYIGDPGYDQVANVVLYDSQESDPLIMDYAGIIENTGIPYQPENMDAIAAWSAGIVKLLAAGGWPEGVLFP